jgi:hypothetical protein
MTGIDSSPPEKLVVVNGVPMGRLRGRSDMERLRTMTDDEIDFSDIPELTDEELAAMKPFSPDHGEPWGYVVLADADVVAWFQCRDDGEAEAAQALREYMERHRSPAA